MATAVRAHDDDGGKAAPSSVAEDGNHHRLPLEASLRQMKFASGGYLNNPNGVTDSKFLSASHDHARSLRSAGLSKQAGQTRKIFRDFRIADQPKKQRIVECLAQTLLKMTPRRLSSWTIAAKSSPHLNGLLEGYAQYEIGADGRLVDVSDVNLDGLQDRARVEVDHKGKAYFDNWRDPEEGNPFSGQLDEGMLSGFLDLLQDVSRQDSRRRRLSE
ncbi:unnamed protein product [Ascophyllum nodosum]